MPRNCCQTDVFDAAEGCCLNVSNCYLPAVICRPIAAGVEASDVASANSLSRKLVGIRKNWIFPLLGFLGVVSGFAISVIFVASSIFDSLDRDVTGIYQFDWTIKAIEFHLENNAGDWPDGWHEIAQALDHVNTSGACPWTIDEIRGNVRVDFLPSGTAHVTGTAT